MLGSEMPELRTSLKGRSERPWLRLGFEDLNGNCEEFDLVADTGCPMAIVLRPNVFDRFQRFQASPEHTSFGFLQTGWFRLTVPSLRLVRSVHCYRSQTAADIVTPPNSGSATLHPSENRTCDGRIESARNPTCVHRRDAHHGFGRLGQSC